MIRVDDETGLGVALATDCNGRFAKLDPYAGAQLALAEAYRNVAVAGARPLAVSDCLNFGSPEDPDVMWQFAEAIRGLADGCQTLGIPVTGGNVSLYNQTGTTAILPTPVVAVLGVIDDVRRRTPSRLHRGGAPDLPARHDPRRAVRLGVGRTSCTTTSAGCRPASTWPPSVRWPTCSSLPGPRGCCRRPTTSPTAGSRRRWSSPALRRGIGVSVDLPSDLDPFVALFAESAARALVAVAPGSEDAFRSHCDRFGVPLADLGVTGGDALVVSARFEVPLAELHEAWSATLRTALA